VKGFQKKRLIPGTSVVIDDGSPDFVADGQFSDNHIDHAPVRGERVGRRSADSSDKICGDSAVAVAWTCSNDAGR